MLIQFGLDQGLSLDTCLQSTGLTPLDLADGQREVDANQELQLIANLIHARPGVADLGLQAGLRYRLT
ncbi:MAG TPA: AraC family transcriptional regulator ligand-binding domain-containing protein, partial [Pseudomonas sp.]|nr:AraC family transcriptional regulator ligand-binding domain-containing protein [Pseudomonas sp.]